MGNLLAGKNILVMGVRNKWSIAWGIVNAAINEGANIIITYQGEREKKGASELGADSIFQCDISSDQDIDNLFAAIKEKYGTIHGVVHSIAHANTEDLQNDFIYTSREGFAHAMDVSAYSLVAVSRRAKEIMTEGGSIITLTYMGSEKVFPGYNVMGVAKAALEASVRYLASDLGPSGIKVNAISAGPIKTLSAKGVKNFGSILDTVEEKAPLRRNVTTEDVGKTALYLLSDLSSGVTGEIIHVDSGYHIMGI
ncbi:enoyl-ACP reductase FabI [Acetivibrio saccincola]|jgi:enoyl-[acyl-carrier protein] reductase I|uniref:Enoyl-[acyl-carrier-protein] reductase [NADH] n=1 Tax=Acetivibrio saccincola TaxID=1677857 RepID=A0A2K9DZU1_9FIRM|nr:SDR family oxidoreductase [Acetivibrio saccincola]AUG57032.1 Enoyl-[acyl-carrier-protein] reductase [NADH] FabI [Acetivibrio saccincola]NLW25921.1 SDR family oxidoreductase [Acetivibrio saccincola]